MLDDNTNTGEKVVNGDSESEAMVRNLKKQVCLIEAWGDWFSQFDWDWFMTLTFRGQMGFWGADRRFWELIRALRKVTGHRAEFFRVADRQKFRNNPHFHCLVGNVKEANQMKWVNWWWRRNGTARIYPYDKTKGARFYLAKHLVKPDGDFLMSRGIKKIYLPNMRDEPTQGYPNAHLS